MISTEHKQTFRVVYDEEKNRYFRVNKLTGDLQPSYKTGKLPAKFDPQVTGTDYHGRKKFNQSYNKNLSPAHSGKHSTATTNYGRKLHTQSTQKAFTHTRQLFSITEPIQPQQSTQSQRQQVHSPTNKFTTKDHTMQTKKQSQLTNYSNLLKDSRNDTTLLLPKLKKPQSFLLLQPLNSQKKNMNSSIFSTKNHLRQQTKQKKVKDSYNQTVKNQLTKNLNLKFRNSYNQYTEEYEPQSRGLEVKLKRYCELEESKVNQNNYHPLENDQKSQRFQKFSDKSLLNSILDDSRLTLGFQQRQKSLFSNVQKNERHTITRNDVIQSIDNLEKQNASLLLLAKQCQKPQQFKMGIKHPTNQSPQKNSPIINLQLLEQEHKLKSLIQKQKSTFLSFYPKYVFKENPRLIQQQKDRKINLKKLEKSFLQNGQKRYGKIYLPQNQQIKEPQ